MKKAFNKSYAESQLERDREWVSRARQERLERATEINRKDRLLAQIEEVRSDLIRRGQIGQIGAFKIAWKTLAALLNNNDLYARAKVATYGRTGVNIETNLANSSRWFSPFEYGQKFRELKDSVINGTFDVDAFNDFFDRNVQGRNLSTEVEEFQDIYWDRRQISEDVDSANSIDADM